MKGASKVWKGSGRYECQPGRYEWGQEGMNASQEGMNGVRKVWMGPGRYEWSQEGMNGVRKVWMGPGRYEWGQDTWTIVSSLWYILVHLVVHINYRRTQKFLMVLKLFGKTIKWHALWQQDHLKLYRVKYILKSQSSDKNYEVKKERKWEIK